VGAEEAAPLEGAAVQLVRRPSDILGAYLEDVEVTGMSQFVDESVLVFGARESARHDC
jgi:hypothetical protein